MRFVAFISLALLSMNASNLAAADLVSIELVGDAFVEDHESFDETVMESFLQSGRYETDGRSIYSNAMIQQWGRHLMFDGTIVYGSGAYRVSFNPSHQLYYDYYDDLFRGYQDMVFTYSDGSTCTYPLTHEIFAINDRSYMAKMSYQKTICFSGCQQCSPLKLHEVSTDEPYALQE